MTLDLTLAPRKKNTSDDAHISISFEQNDLLPDLFGFQNEHIKHIEEKLGIDISTRGNAVKFSGKPEACGIARDVLMSLYKKLKHKHDLELSDVSAEIRLQSRGKSKTKTHEEQESLHGFEPSDSDIVIQTQRKNITPYSKTQAKYIRALMERELVIGSGPAGTGKTYIAVAAAVSMFVHHRVDRIILCRPAVEAGEKIGFLPGDMREKIDPYLRPLYDALYDMLPAEKVVKYMETGEIEIAPLAFMRGRTLRHAAIILDEAQNTTTAQMKMFLTRLGEGSRMVLTGDLTQTDLPKDVRSGLRDAVEVLSKIPEVTVIRFGEEDIVRHALTAKIVSAYEAEDKKRRLLTSKEEEGGPESWFS